MYSSPFVTYSRPAAMPGVGGPDPHRPYLDAQTQLGRAPMPEALLGTEVVRTITFLSYSPAVLDMLYNDTVPHSRLDTQSIRAILSAGLNSQMAQVLAEATARNRQAVDAVLNQVLDSVRRELQSSRGVFDAFDVLLDMFTNANTTSELRVCDLATLIGLKDCRDKHAKIDGSTSYHIIRSISNQIRYYVPRLFCEITAELKKRNCTHILWIMCAPPVNDTDITYVYTEEELKSRWNRRLMRLLGLQDCQEIAPRSKSSAAISSTIGRSILRALEMLQNRVSGAREAIDDGW